RRGGHVSPPQGRQEGPGRGGERGSRHPAGRTSARRGRDRGRGTGAGQTDARRRLRREDRLPPRGGEREERRAGAGGSVSSLATNARVVRALGMRSVRQTFRRPQLIAPIIVFPPRLLAITTGGASGAVELPGFPPVQSFLQFMLAGAMMQSLMLAGNSGGIALAGDIEMGFTDRLFSAPIPRFAIVLGRLAGTAALGLFGSLWFLTIGLIFGAEIVSGVPGALMAIFLVTASATAVG